MVEASNTVWSGRSHALLLAPEQSQIHVETAESHRGSAELGLLVSPAFLCCEKFPSVSYCLCDFLSLVKLRASLWNF